jgi:hypothetical protein
MQIMTVHVKTQFIITVPKKSVHLQGNQICFTNSQKVHLIITKNNNKISSIVKKGDKNSDNAAHYMI